MRCLFNYLLIGQDVRWMHEMMVLTLELQSSAASTMSHFIVTSDPSHPPDPVEISALIANPPSHQHDNGSVYGYFRRL